MEHSFFAYIFRMRYIARWALMRNTRIENVEEHSYEAAVLAHALAVIGRDVFDRDINPDAIAAAALFHDAPEIITGDMPTPIKYNNPSRYVKAADKLAAWLKCLEERKAGNSEFRRAEEETMASLRSMGMEEVDWFLDRMGGAFQLTLDDLG